MRYDAKITLETDFGALEDVPVMISYDTRRIYRDPTVGDFAGYTEVDTCEIVSAHIGGLILSRYQIAEMVGDDEVRRQEDLIAENIMARIAAE